MSWITVTIIIFIYLIFVLFLGTWASRGQKSSVLEYVAANRGFGFFIMYFLLGGAIFSAFAFLGGPGWAYSKGAAAFYMLGFSALGLVPWWLWGIKTYRAGIRFNFVTQAQLFSNRFQSKALSVIMALISLLAFVQYISLQMKGSGYIFEIASGGRIPFWAGALIAYVVVLIYVFIGGIKGVAWTHVFQSIFMMVIAWTLGLYLAFDLYGGPGKMFEEIIEHNPRHLLIGPGTSISFSGYTSALLVSFLGFALWPQLFMKAFTAQSEKVIKKTVVMYPTFAIMTVPVLFIGFAGILQVSPEVLGPPDRILPWMFTNLEFPSVAIGLILAAALAAAMSTQDAVTHAAGTVFAQDFIEPLKKHKSNDKTATRWVRLSVIGFGAIAYLIAIFGGQTLVALLLGAYGSIVQFLPLACATFFWRRISRAGAISGLLVGFFFNQAITFELIPKLWDVDAGIQGLLLNFAVMFLVSVFTKAPEKDHVDKYLNL
jgi:solute:Na+ symporter, SSS family